MEREIRILADAGFEIRGKKGDARSIRGYAAIFNTLSENLGGFREQIAPGAFDDCMENDVRALINHDANLILGRTTSKTLALSQDAKGLVYEAQLPDTSYANDLAASMVRGDITQSSFAFNVAAGGDDWTEDPDTGQTIRTVKKIARLYDVSPVTYPAYTDASAGLRCEVRAALESLAAHRQAHGRRARPSADPLDARRRQLIDIELDARKHELLEIERSGRRQQLRRINACAPNRHRVISP